MYSSVYSSYLLFRDILCSGQSIFVAPGVLVYCSGTDITIPYLATGNSQIRLWFHISLVMCAFYVFALSLCHLVSVWVDQLFVQLLTLSPVF